MLGSEATFRQRDVPARVRFLVRMGFCLGNGGGEIGQTPAPDGYRGHDGHAQSFGKCGRIEHQPVTLRQIDHVKRHDCRAPEFKDFLREDKVLFEIGRIDDEDDDVGKRFAIEFTMDNLAGYLLIRAGGIETVRTG